MYSTWTLQRRMSEKCEALTVSSFTFKTCCSLGSHYANTGCAGLLYNQLHSIQILNAVPREGSSSNPGNGVIYHELSLCAMNRRPLEVIPAKAMDEHDQCAKAGNFLYTTI